MVCFLWCLWNTTIHFKLEAIGVSVHKRLLMTQMLEINRNSLLELIRGAGKMESGIYKHHKFTVCRT